MTRTSDVTALGLAALSGLAVASSASAQMSSPRERIEAIAGDSRCAAVDWADRGPATKSYFRGVALVFAKAVCRPERPEVKVVAEAPGVGPEADRRDALAWYDAIFRQTDMPNADSGMETLRHAYVLLLGLGMRESSGRYCVGRDRSADFSTADSAEAGLRNI